MKKLILISALLLFGSNVWADIKQITCEYFVDQNKYDESNNPKYFEPEEMFKNMGINIGDIWSTSVFTFDTDDFSSDKKIVTIEESSVHERGIYYTKEAPYVVSPEWISFNSDDEYPDVINRKTLRYQRDRVTPYKCSIVDVDVSENVF